MTKVSVVIPNYNYEKYLQPRLSSVVRQTYRNFEILFLDDCSQDSSVAYAKTVLSEEDIPFKIYLNEKNSGSPFFQWNKGIKKAKGEYIWIAEADDLCENSFLEEMVSLLEGDPNIGLAYCQTTPVDQTGKTITDFNYIQYTDSLDRNKWLSEYTNNGRHEVENYLCRLCTIINVSSVLFRREGFIKTGYVDTDYKQAGDWLTYIKLLQHYDIAYTPKKLNYHRIHPSKRTSNTVTNLIYFKDMLNVFQYTRAHFHITENTRKLQFEHILGQWNDHYNGIYGKISHRKNLELFLRLSAFYPKHIQKIFRQYLKTLTRPNMKATR